MLTISTDSFRGYGLNRIFQMVKQAGYDGIDLSIDPKNFDTQNTEYVKSLVEETGLPVLAIQTPTNANAKKIQKAVQMARELGTKVIVIQPPRIFDFKYIQWLKNETPKIRQKENISIALENAPSKNFLGIIPEHAMGGLLDLKKFKHACLDTSRVAQKKEDLMRVYSALKKYLVHVHLSNVKGGNQYYLPQKGIIPIESFLTKLKQDGFRGAISIKVNGKYMNTGDDEKVMEELKEMKKYYDKYFGNIQVSKKTADPADPQANTEPPAEPAVEPPTATQQTGAEEMPEE
jgi:sugar phosphate isomerase/epimerase